LIVSSGSVPLTATPAADRLYTSNPSPAIAASTATPSTILARGEPSTPAAPPGRDVLPTPLDDEIRTTFRGRCDVSMKGNLRAINVA